MGETTSSHEVDIDASYNFYEELLRGVNLAHPQHQGLRREEFNNALANPDVVKTHCVTEGMEVYLPQLTPVSQFQWLNAPVYSQKYPAAAESGNLLHLTLLTEIEPGLEVGARLQEMAKNEGVVVLDYPSIDPGYPSRVAEYLASLRIDIASVDELATQTYFAGHIQLKRKIADEESIDGIAAAFDKAKLDGDYDMSRVENGASIFRTIDLEQARHMNGFYEAAYRELNATEFCNQGIDSIEFLHMLVEDDTVIKVVNSVNGEVVSLLLLDNDLNKLTWVNADYYKHKYPKKFEHGQVMWFPGLAANPNKPGGMNTQVMVNLLAQLCEKGNNELLVVFDCGLINTGFLDVFLNAMINKTPETSIDIQPIAEQKYVALKTKLSK
jgi:hypothetical protein